jgi:hypothetical protein
MPGFALPADEKAGEGTFSMHKDEMYTRLQAQDQMEEMTRQMEEMARPEGSRKTSKASKASTVGSEKKKSKKSFFEGVRTPFSRKNSRNEEYDQ